MTRVDFYVLHAQTSGDAAIVACRLVEKAYLSGNRVFLKTATSADSQHLDKLLWTFRDGSFVPHGIAESANNDSGEEPVLIGTDESIATKANLLINMGERLPQDPAAYSKIAEIVGSDEASRTNGRLRFRAYRERGFEVTTHNLSQPE